MRKRIAGAAFLTAAALIMVQPVQKAVERNPEVSKQGEEGHILTFLSKEAEPMPKGRVPVTLVETIDGDTIKVNYRGKIEPVRYLLIDTPESKKPGMCIQPYAQKASIRNNELVKSGALTLEFERGEERDTYGRLLAYVYGDGTSIQETLLKEGLARVGYIMNPPYQYLKLYREAESLAKRNKVGIWSQPGFVTNRGFNGCLY